MLREEDWDRVVAVFVLGKSWQFKGWKWSQPAELFDRVLGVYLMIQGQTMEPEVSSWNCKVIKVCRLFHLSSFYFQKKKRNCLVFIVLYSFITMTDCLDS